VKCSHPPQWSGSNRYSPTFWFHVTLLTPLELRPHFFGK